MRLTVFVLPAGRDSLLHWIHSPVYPNTTMSWNIVYGNRISQLKLTLYSITIMCSIGLYSVQEVEKSHRLFKNLIPTMWG